MLSINSNIKLYVQVMVYALGLLFSSNMPPLTPTVYAKADSGKVIINWTSESINSIDSQTGYRDFEGFRIYKSTDGGITWGDVDDRIYYNGVQKGWKPLVQFDLETSVDSLFCLKEVDCDIESDPTRGKSISGPDPLAPWVSLGDDTGLSYTYTDTDVFNGKEYTYAVVSYDMGLRTYEPSYSQNSSLDGLCTDSSGNTGVDAVSESECCSSNGGNWDSSDNTCTFTEACSSCNWSMLYEQIQSWDVTNPDRVVCFDNLEQNDFDCKSNLDEISCSSQDLDDDGINDCYYWSAGFPSVECEIADINTVKVVPGFYAENVENISYDGVADAEGIILIPESQTIGNGSKLFQIVNEDDLSGAVYRFEVQADADEGEIVFENYKTKNPTLFVYEINNTTDKAPVNPFVYDFNSANIAPGAQSINEGFQKIIDFLELAATPTVCNSTFPLFYNEEQCATLLKEDLLDLPGSEESVDGVVLVPDYKFQYFELKFIDDLSYSSNFTDFIDGLKFRFDNSLRYLPLPLKQASINSIEYISVNAATGLVDTSRIDDDDFLRINLKYGFEGAAFYKKPPYSYKLVLSSTPRYPVKSTSIESACSDNPNFTLLPFEVYNLTTGRRVGIMHNDGDYTNCFWEPGEGVAFKFDPVNTTTTLAGSSISCDDLCTEYQWCNEGVCEDLEEYTFDLDFNFPAFVWGGADTLNPSTEYLVGDNVKYNDMIFEAVSVASPGTIPTEWIDNNFGETISEGDCALYEDSVWYGATGSGLTARCGDGVNDNPWKPSYPWNDGEEIIIEPMNWYVDGDSWIADFSEIGRKDQISQSDLSSISVVPNPYLVRSRYDETASSRLMWFTHLPTYCYISIYTVSGELVNSFEHNDDFSGQKSWDLRTGDGDEIAPGLYIYTVETGPSAPYDQYKHIGKFAVVR